MSFAERLKEAMEYRNYRQVDLVNKTKIDKGTISNYLKGKYEPKNINTSLIADALDVNALWLAEIEGVPMLKDTNTEYLYSNEEEVESYTTVEFEKGFEDTITKEKWNEYYDKIMTLPDAMKTELYKYVLLYVSMAEMKERADKRKKK